MSQSMGLTTDAHVGRLRPKTGNHGASPEGEQEIARGHIRYVAFARFQPKHHSAKSQRHTTMYY